MRERFTDNGDMNWMQLSDGSLVNFDNVHAVRQDGATALLVGYGGVMSRLQFSSASVAASYVSDLLNSLTTGAAVNNTITPNTATHSVAGVAVVKGSGFALDITTAVFHGTVTIGVDDITTSAVTYVDNNTLLLAWTPTNAGTFDVVYKNAAGEETFRITSGIVIS